ncbi:MAG: hypothetical protein J0I49_33400 [Pseudonocardia sp.]|uniref:hypothetical protein n=1 Tax=Pseudonocardia sp. TaxID=60912 RepID=UPI001ACC9BEC|nr:hypothetical protein [Pseudonocardia sp.]MBN9102954.1 hypothetical protein [Pseudonocardia sp.]
MRVLVHAPGPPRHGVVRHAWLVARLAEAHGVRSAGGAADLTHVQFTDALFGPDVAAAATAFEVWAATVPRPLVVTLHDVPGADPDPARDAHRGRGYARVAAVADAVVVSSEHEAANLERSTGRSAAVIPLPVETLPTGGARPAWAGRPTLAVLGFVYPGKGHADAIDAAARSGIPLVAALGAVADGHAGLHRELRERAADRGVDLLVTGSLTDADLAAAAAAATVPLAPARRVSASGSLATWIGCGRRPVAARGPYTAELAARHPDGLWLYDTDAELDAAVAACQADPSWTRAEPGAGPDVGPDVGAAHAALYRRVLAC